MKRWPHLVSLALLALLCAGCLGPKKNLFPPAAGAPRKSIHIVSHGWHASVIVSRADIPTNIWPAQRDFAEFESIEVGWGDDGFYRADKITLGITFKALFWPTPSVLHVVGFNGPPEQEYPSSQVIRVDLSEEGFTQLCQYIDRAHTQTATGQAIPLGPGLYGTSEFYRANESYYFPKTCNTWTAGALRAAGCPITPLWSITSGRVVSQVKKFGTMLEPADRNAASKKDAPRP
jgi:uncharacterized protein (TIGR02117 family)